MVEIHPHGQLKVGIEGGSGHHVGNQLQHLHIEGLTHDEGLLRDGMLNLEEPQHCARHIEGIDQRDGHRIFLGGEGGIFAPTVGYQMGGNLGVGIQSRMIERTRRSPRLYERNA